jgi:hypothetical protein
MRFRTANGYADLTGCDCIAEIWNPGRTERYLSVDCTWGSRVILDPEQDYHLLLSIDKGALPEGINDAMWSLKLVQPDGVELLVEEGPFGLFQDWIEVP